MRMMLFFILLFPFMVTAQKLKVNAFDKYIKQNRIEVAPLPIVANDKAKTSLAFVSVASNLYLELSGSGWGSFTIDSAGKIIFLFSNDSTVTLKSTSLQGVETGTLANSYRHQYYISPNELEPFCSYDLVGIRKYSFQDFSDLAVPRQSIGPIKNLGNLFRTELKKAHVLNELKRINQSDIKKYVGDSVTFCTKVVATRYDAAAENKPTQLQLQPDASTQAVNAVIWEEDRKRFTVAPETVYNGKDVCVFGVVQMQNGTPQLVIRSKKQIRVTSLISEREAAMFIGDSITVVGKVVSGVYLADAKNQPTLLNMGVPYPDQDLTVVIGTSDRQQFGEQPEKYYQNKQITVSGRVTLYKNKPQITISRREQIKVLGEVPATTATTAASVTTTMTTTPAGSGSTTALIGSPVTLPTSSITVAPAVHREKVNISSYYTETFSAFPGGTNELVNFMKANLHCPEGGKSAKVMTVSYSVDSDGSLTKFEVVESAGKQYDNEVIRVLKLLPKWIPRIRNGYAVLDKLYQTITFNCSPGSGN